MGRNRRTGFTLVELVIVIAVIAVLATVLVPTFSGVLKKAKDNTFIVNGNTRYKEMLTHTGKHIDCYYTENKQYMVFDGRDKIYLGSLVSDKFSEDADNKYSLKDDVIADSTTERTFCNIDYIIEHWQEEGSGKTNPVLPDDPDDPDKPDPDDPDKPDPDDPDTPDPDNPDTPDPDDPDKPDPDKPDPDKPDPDKPDPDDPDKPDPPDPVYISVNVYGGEQTPTTVKGKTEAEVRSGLQDLMKNTAASEQTTEVALYSDALRMEMFDCVSGAIVDGMELYLGEKTKDECFDINSAGALKFKDVLRSAKTVIVPAIVNGIQVKSFNFDADKNANMFENVKEVLAEVKELRILAPIDIPKCAFKDIFTLECVYLCDGVKNLGRMAFSDCFKLEFIVAPGLTQAESESLNTGRTAPNNKLQLFVGQTTPTLHDDNIEIYLGGQWEVDKSTGLPTPKPAA